MLSNAEKSLVPYVPGENSVVEYLSSIASMYGHPFAIAVLFQYTYISSLWKLLN